MAACVQFCYPGRAFVTGGRAPHLIVQQPSAEISVTYCATFFGGIKQAWGNAIRRAMPSLPEVLDAFICLTERKWEGRGCWWVPNPAVTLLFPQFSEISVNKSVKLPVCLTVRETKCYPTVYRCFLRQFKVLRAVHTAKKKKCVTPSENFAVYRFLA